jgi:hypothetical protein
MTNKSVRNFLKALTVFAMAASFVSVSSGLAAGFTVEKGKRYRATLSLKSIERLAALGFSRVRVSGSGATRRVEGVWLGRDASAPLPPQIVAVAKL